MRKEHRTILIQIALFVTTFFTTTIAGAEWVYGKSILKVTADGDIGLNADFFWADFFLGMEFSVPFLLILTVHEFGHYFFAVYHKVKTSLPYYIPFPPIFLSIGTLGAVIRLKEKVKSNVQNFDIGLAGPLAGFVVALIVVTYGFLTLPPAESIFEIHPEYKQFGLNYADSVYTKQYLEKHQVIDVQIGTNLLFQFFGKFVADESRVPNAHEMMHSPFLLAGFIALFFTSMNLLPIGQLDGGHITYGLFGWVWHRRIATIFFLGLILYAGIGMVSIHSTPKNQLAFYIPLTILFYYFCFGPLGFAERDRIMTAVLIFGIQFVVSWLFPFIQGKVGWVFFAFIASRLAGIQHPPSEIEEPLDSKRIILGWIALIIFIISFSPNILEIGGQ
jgi:membrane-associated protease RseP (regulator of RpoE activity)